LPKPRCDGPKPMSPPLPTDCCHMVPPDRIV
jgi:hypothetical protein